MKHPSTRGFFAYWDEKRGDAAAPDRANLEPGPVRHLLGDCFVLSYEVAAGFPFRVAGTRVSALLGRELKGESFTALWNDESRRGIEDLVAISVEETLGTVAGVTATAHDGSRVYLELLLLPFQPKPHTPVGLTGTLSPLTVPARLGPPGLSDFLLTSWRHVGHRPQTLRRRALRRWTAARGFVVYEGLRDNG